MVDSLHESSSVEGDAQPARRIRLRTATMIAATPVVVGLLMLSSSVLYSPGPEPLDRDVPEARATAEEFAATWFRGSTARAFGYAAQTSGISLEWLDRDRQYFVSHEFEIVGPARFARNTFMGLPGYVLPLEGLQGSHRLSYTLVGDPVNVASRIQGLTKEFGADILVSADTARRLHTPPGLEAVSAVMMKGKSTAVEIYRVV